MVRKKQKNGNILTWIIILIAIALGAYAFFGSGSSKFAARDKADTDTKDEIKEKEKEKAVVWEDALVEIRAILQTRVEDDSFRIGAPSVQSEADITGDGISEALVFTGGGGAATDEVAVFIMSKGKPALAQIQGRDGVVLDAVHLVGSGGSGRYGFDAKLLSDAHGFVFSGYSSYGTSDDYCSSDVYIWNEVTGVFVYSSELAKTQTTIYCKEFPQ